MGRIVVGYIQMSLVIAPAGVIGNRQVQSFHYISPPSHRSQPYLSATFVSGHVYISNNRIRPDTNINHDEHLYL